ncbi:hypothetical protein BGZ49_007567 [Haplosporangium sp. Z 27]|nr:hypothetical protein BGZ49_007567 [Haplosporangium sp. Z 27]
MKATTPNSPHSPKDSPMDDVVSTSSRRGSINHHHHTSSQEYQPTSPAKRNSHIIGNGYPPADYSNPQNVYGNGNNLSNGHSHHPDDQAPHHQQPQYYQDRRNSYQGYPPHNDQSNGQYHQDHPSRHYHHSGVPNTPSPPLPSAADAFQGRPLPPIEPSHPLHNYMSTSRRSSIADQEYQNNPNGSGATDLHQRASTTAEISGYYGNSPRDARDPALAENNRHYANSSPSSTTSTSTVSESTPFPHTPNSPLHLRQKAAVAAEYASGRRESLPSIYSSAGPLGQLLAQEPQRRHSIAHSELLMGGNNSVGGPLKRKTSGTPLSQVHSSADGNNSTMDHPAKRRDSIPDVAAGYHNHQHQHHHHPYAYPPRNSYSAPSSPPRRGSIAPTGGPVPTLSLQPAAEIKTGPSGMDHSGTVPAVAVRPHFPLHQPRRPSLLSSEAGSRRSSIVDLHHAHGPQPHHLSHSSYSQQQQQQQQQQDYDQRMNMDMEKMHLSNQTPSEPQHHLQHRGSLQGLPGTVPPPPSQGNIHLYPGYPAAYSADGTGAALKGETPYSRSPELRVSHKLAERKRRKEMKELFDELRDSLPVDRSLKTSKWEILSKAVDYIAQMKVDQDELTKEVESLRQEVSRLKQ